MHKPLFIYDINQFKRLIQAHFITIYNHWKNIKRGRKRYLFTSVSNTITLCFTCVTFSTLIMIHIMYSNHVFKGLLYLIAEVSAVFIPTSAKKWKRWCRKWGTMILRKCIYKIRSCSWNNSIVVSVFHCMENLCN